MKLTQVRGENIPCKVVKNVHYKEMFANYGG